jgi:chromosome segregation ATPase
MFQHSVHHNPIDTEEGQIKALSLQAHAAQHLRKVIENKDELDKLTTMLDNFSVKHAETLKALETQKEQLKLLTETGKQLEERRLEIQNTHDENLAFVAKEHENRMAEFNAHVEEKYKEIKGSEDALRRHKEKFDVEMTERNADALRIETGLSERAGSLETREEEHQKNVAKLAEDREKLQAFAGELSVRHEKVAHLEKESLAKV